MRILRQIFHNLGGMRGISRLFREYKGHGEHPGRESRTYGDRHHGRGRGPGLGGGHGRGRHRGF